MIDIKQQSWFIRILITFGEILLVFGALIGSSILVYGLSSVTGVDSQSMSEPFGNLFVAFIPQILLFILGMYVCNNIFFKRPWAVTGFVKKGWLQDTSDGYILAFILVGGGYAILRLGGYLSSEGVEFEPYYFFGFFLMFIVQSAGEEVLLRSWMMPAIESRLGPWAALLLSSGLFALIHAGNPNVNWIGLLNICLAGLMLGMFFLKYRNIWFITGLHAGWNWIQSVVFDFNVSGFDVKSTINFNPYGNELISGGAFGFEGSIVSVVLQLIVIGYLLVKHYDDMFGNRPEYYVANDVATLEPEQSEGP